MPRLTKRSVDALIAKSKDYFVWESYLVGFGVRVLPSGAKTYQVQYRKGALSTARRKARRSPCAGARNMPSSGKPGSRPAS